MFIHAHTGSPRYVRETGRALTSTAYDLARAAVAAAGRLGAPVEVGRVEPAARANEHRALSEQVRHPDGEAQGGRAVRAVHHVVRDTPERLRIGVYLCVRLPSVLFRDDAPLRRCRPLSPCCLLFHDRRLLFPLPPHRRRRRSP